MGEASRSPLTQVERKVYHFLIDFVAQHTFQPSVREIARQFRIPSTKTVTDLLAAIEAKGYIRRTPGRSRGVVIVGHAGGVGTQPVPILRLAADRSLEPEGSLTLDRSRLPSDDCFLVRAQVEDAPAHAVLEGDLLLVHPGARAADEVPVVARVGTVIVVRAMERRGAALLLRAPRAGADDIEIGAQDDFEILGPLAGVLRLPSEAARD